MTEGIVLAAGLSSRSGRYKMALPLGDKSLIERAIEGMHAVVDRVLVIVGWRAEQVRELLSPYEKVELVTNPDYRAGMFSSVQAGVAHVRASRFFVLPGDCAWVSAQIYRQLLTAEGDIVIPTFQGKTGHPVLMRGALAAEILALPQEATLRDYIASKGFVAVAVEDDGILLDVDTPQDYEAALSRFKQLNRKEVGG